MKISLKAMVLAATLSTISVGALAMDMNHGDMAGMKMDNDTVMLETIAVDGVEGSAHLKDIQAAMAKMAMPQTHHFMTMFTNTKGEPVNTGLAAVKITDPSGNTGKPIKLMGMGDGFGADVTLAVKGAYTFSVGTKLNDGEKRTFTFHYSVK